MAVPNDKLSSGLKELKIENKTALVEIEKSNRVDRMLSASSVENLSFDSKQQLYMDRLSYLKDKLNDIDLQELDIKPEDLIDKHCDPENPIKVTFNDVSAAAYRIRAGIEMTPCIFINNFHF